MTLRAATRVLTGRPSCHVDVVLGFGVEGRPAATVHPHGYNRTPFSLTDAAVVRELITDLTAALDHLEPEQPALTSQTSPP